MPLVSLPRPILTNRPTERRVEKLCALHLHEEKLSLSRRTRRRIHSVCTCVHILHMLSQYILYYTTLYIIVYYINLYKLFNLICLSICPSICQSVSPSGQCSSLCHPETPRRNNVSSPPSKHLCLHTHSGTHTQTHTSWLVHTHTLCNYDGCPSFCLLYKFSILNWQRLVQNWN